MSMLHAFDQLTTEHSAAQSVPSAQSMRFMEAGLALVAITVALLLNLVR